MNNLHQGGQIIFALPKINDLLSEGETLGGSVTHNSVFHNGSFSRKTHYDTVKGYLYECGEGVIRTVGLTVCQGCRWCNRPCRNIDKATQQRQTQSNHSLIKVIATLRYDAIDTRNEQNENYKKYGN